MPITNGFTWSKQIEYSAAEVGISGVSLKAGTAYVGNIIDLSEYKDFALDFVAVVVGAATVGTAKVQMEFFDHNQNTLWLGPVDAWTGITPFATAGTNLHLASFCDDRVGAADVGTIVATGPMNMMMASAFCRFTLQATVVSDAATSCLGSLLLRAQT